MLNDFNLAGEGDTWTSAWGLKRLDEFADFFSRDVFMLRGPIRHFFVWPPRAPGRGLMAALLQAQGGGQQLDVTRIGLIPQSSVRHPEHAVEDLDLFKIASFGPKSPSKFHIKGLRHASLIPVKALVGAGTGKVVSVHD